jgi:hypothetical protein
MTYRIDARTWKELIAQRRKAKQEAEAAAQEMTFEEKLNRASERVHKRSASTHPQRATIVREPDEGLRRFHELIAEAKKK